MEPPNQPPHGQPRDTPPGDPGRREPTKVAKAAGATGKAAQATGRAGRSAFRKARQLTHAQGAGESGLARLLELHAVNTGGDAAVAVALAGTLFFAGATSEARSDVAWFLLLTMLPFAIVAPLIGPFLDRFRRGRRWAIGATMAIRAFCCWILADAVATDATTTLYPAALGVLVSSKAYGVTRASAVPRLLPPDITLVKANSRISLTGTAGAVLSGPLAAGTAYFGAEWTCRYAFVLFVIATILAILLPERVDSSEGEEQVDMATMSGAVHGTKRRAIASSVVGALRGNAGLRFLTGFLLMYMAFVLRDPPFDGWDTSARSTILLGAVLGSLGAGQTLGTAIAAIVRSRAPESVIVVVLVVDAVVVVLCTAVFAIPTAVLVALTAGLCASLGKLSLDALIQRDVPESVRTSVFARSETLMQLSWVVGGFVGILAPLEPAQVGLTIASVCLVLWTVFVLQARISSHRSRASHPRAPAERADPAATRRERHPDMVSPDDPTVRRREPGHAFPDDPTAPERPPPERPPRPRPPGPQSEEPDDGPASRPPYSG